MPDTTPHPDDRADDTDTADTADEDEARREERAEELYEEAEAEGDPVTRREALEGELEEEGLSDEGEELGEHIE